MFLNIKCFCLTFTYDNFTIFSCTYSGICLFNLGFLKKLLIIIIVKENHELIKKNSKSVVKECFSQTIILLFVKLTSVEKPFLVRSIFHFS